MTQQRKGDNYRLKDVTRTQQRPESAEVTLTWTASKHKVYELIERYTPTVCIYSLMK